MAQKEPFVLKQFNGGWNTEVVSDYLNPAESPDLENVDFSASGSIKKDWGFAQLSPNSDDDPNISKELWVFPDRDGVQWLLKRTENKLKIYDSVNERFDVIDTNLDNDAGYAAEYFDTVIYFAGDSQTGFTFNLTKISRLTSAVSSGDAVIEVDDIEVFDSSGVVRVGDVEVSYTGKSGDTLTGCTGTPDADANSLIVQRPVTASEIPESSITAVYAGRLFVAEGSTLYGSKLTDLDNFTVTGSGTGDAIQKTLESKINALRVFYDDNNNLRLMAFAANNKIYTLDTIDSSELSSTLTSSSRFKESTTALNQNTTVVGFNDMYHIDLENQVRSLGKKYANQGVNKVYSDSISTQHRSLFKKHYDFSNAKGIIFNNELWITCAYNSDSNNRVIMVDTTTGAWRQRTDINANWIELYDNKLIWTDVKDNKVYYLDEELMSDNDETMKFTYSTPDLDVSKLQFERLRRVRLSGFISSSCETRVSIYRDFATIKIGEFTLKGNNTEIVGGVLGETGVYGSVLFGEESFGGDPVIDKRFFIADLELDNLPDLENFRIVFENNQSNVYFELTALKPFIMPMDDDYFPERILENN